ncbi:type VII secretion integral membrane protein EccD [Saccharopolyspora subtropica]|uniref:Type VII secretion integral membrane protein EccD n=1 Tax=Saccharopolyspora thermophila TaxID=89367 RepID=A0A917K9V3_9PSEU|nr:type VII secretion integral membrane protein EccD [Saccharopolyspora subtropica]GGJ03118.1 type VII secretion integral membrane protein EccD [Saccharopolyspora subtropica]
MTTAGAAQLCRITVFGPDGKADLAVPVSTTVADLLPVLLKHTRQQPPGAESVSWVLQRLGEAPMDPDGTPETLDWLEGEQLHLRPADDPLPELDFDDLAEGIATSVQQREDRWRPEFGRRLFRVLSCAAVAVIGLVLLTDGPTALHASSAGVLAAVFLVAMTPIARKLHDTALAVLCGLAGCAMAGIGALLLADGVPDAAAPTPQGLFAAGASTAAAAAILLVVRQFAAKDVSFAPLLTVLSVSLAVLALLGIAAGFALTPGQAAGVLSTVAFGFVIFAPRMCLRAAFLRGPQLPRNADDLQQDIDPVPADEVDAKSATADRYLSVVMVSAAVVLAGAYPLVLAEPGWASWAMVGLLSGAVLLRSRNFLGVWQRVPLAISGTLGFTLVTLYFAALFAPVWWLVLLLGLLVVLFALVRAALRPPTRRMLPIWGHLANILDTATAIALVPLLLQLLGVYAWARGLFG